MWRALRLVPLILVLFACQPAFAAVVLTLDPAVRQPDGSYRVGGSMDNTGPDSVELLNDAFTVPAGIVATSLLPALGLLHFIYSPAGISGFFGDIFDFTVPAGHPGGVGRYDLLGADGILASAEFQIPQGAERPVSEPAILLLIASSVIVGGAMRGVVRRTVGGCRSAS